MPQLSHLSVILPVLNERENLEELIPEIRDALNTELTDFEIIVVDDSSTDGTNDLLSDWLKRDHRIKYLSRLGELPSLPDSLTDGIRSAHYEHVCWMDADGSMSPSSLVDLVRNYRSFPFADSIIVGSRFVTGGGFKGIEVVGQTSIRQVFSNLRKSNDSWLAVLLSRILNRFLWLSLDRCCRDLASGFIISRKSDVLRIGLRGSYGDYCVRFIYLAHIQGMKISEVPYVCQVRRHGKSKTGTTISQLIRRGLPYLYLPFRIRLFEQQAINSH
jgi:dolichol-phosphate mannosyltransferase